MSRPLLVFLALLSTACAPLVSASLDGDTARMKQLLADGADPNQRNSEGSSALFLEATYHKRLEVVRMLLDAGANPNLPHGCTDCPYANQPILCGTTDLEIAKLLVERGADPAPEGCSPVCTALQNNAFDTARWLVDQPNARPRELDCVLEKLERTLAGAWDPSPMVPIARTLLERGLVPTPNAAAVTARLAGAPTDQVKSWLGPRLDSLSPAQRKTLLDEGRYLHAAAAVRDAELVRHFLALGADPNRDDIPPLFRLTNPFSEADQATVDALLTGGARADAINPFLERHRVYTTFSQGPKFVDQHSEVMRYLERKTGARFVAVQRPTPPKSEAQRRAEAAAATRALEAQYGPGAELYVVPQDYDLQFMEAILDNTAVPKDKAFPLVGVLVDRSFGAIDAARVILGNPKSKTFFPNSKLVVRRLPGSYTGVLHLLTATSRDLYSKTHVRTATYSISNAPGYELLGISY